jgi:hypothetical protein
MIVTVSYVNTTNGAGKRRFEDGIDTYKTSKDLAEFAKRAKTITVINEDNYCLVRAILIAKYKVDEEKDWYNRKRPGDKRLNRDLQKLVDNLSLPNLERGLDLGHVERIETHLENYQIIVYVDGAREDGPVYWNKGKQECKKKIYIVHDSQAQHFNVLTSMTAYFDKSYFCEKCQKAYGHIGDHSCEATCKSCKRQNCMSTNPSKCKCGTEARNDICFRRHVETVCPQNLKCDTCEGYIRKNRPHICINQRYCKSCREVVDEDHMCYIMTAEEMKKRDKKFAGFIFMDFETYIDAKSGNHVVNLAMAMKVCSKCIDSEIKCEICSRKYVYYSIEEFVDFMLMPENENFQFFAHNSKGFDAQFIIHEIFRRRTPMDAVPKVILNGSKIQALFFRKICIKDSASFLPMKLADFPKAFGLTELRKGHWPHLFNVPENQNYVGPYPQKHFYNYNFMTPSQKKEFLQFYEKARSDAIEVGDEKPFDFKKEFHEYCWSDVKLLAEGCLQFSRDARKYSKLKEDDDGFCPLRESMTLASSCFALFQRNFLKSKQIGLINETAESVNSNASRGSMEWLKWVSFKENINIRHAKNGGEVKIGDYMVDGMCEENKTIYEYNG